MIEITKRKIDLLKHTRTSTLIQIFKEAEANLDELNVPLCKCDYLGRFGIGGRKVNLICDSLISSTKVTTRYGKNTSYRRYIPDELILYVLNEIEGSLF